MKRELKGILSVLQGKRRNVVEYDWHYALGLLLLNRVGVSFYHAARETQTLLPRQVNQILQGLEGQQVRRSRVMAKWIADLSYELMSAGIRFAFLKGSVLSYCPFTVNPCTASVSDRPMISIFSFPRTISAHSIVCLAPSVSCRENGKTAKSIRSTDGRSYTDA